MSLARSKRGMELSTLAEIILVLIGAGFLLSVFLVKSSQADEKTSENLCRGFNALRFGTKLETSIGNYNVAPRACKTIDKKDLPEQEYKDNPNGLTEATKAEMRDLMARCWWMWLEGRQQNMFEKSFYNLQNGCFVCYTFGIDKSVKPFSYGEFAESLASMPYYAIDSTDRCAPAGQGGKCLPSCDASSDYFSKEVASSRCGPNEKCCIAADNRDECNNKGGRCLYGPEGAYSLHYDKWQCKSGSCYIKIDNIATYKDYIENAGGGSGRIISGEPPDELFKSGSKYAITFVSPGKSWDISTLFGLITTSGGLYVLGAGLASGIGTIPTLILLTATTASAYITSASGTINDINYILISKYDAISSKCAIEAGVGQK